MSKKLYVCLLSWLLLINLCYGIVANLARFLIAACRLCHSLLVMFGCTGPECQRLCSLCSIVYKCCLAWQLVVLHSVVSMNISKKDY